MDRDEFDRVLQEEGLHSQILRDIIWNERPRGSLDAAKLRRTCRWFRSVYPDACRKDATRAEVLAAIRP